jgi:hypothetical protein
VAAQDEAAVQDIVEEAVASVEEAVVRPVTRTCPLQRYYSNSFLLRESVERRQPNNLD